MVALGAARRRLATLAALLVLAAMIVVGGAGSAEARPMPTGLDVQMGAGCSSSVSWNGGRGWLFVRLSRHVLTAGDPVTGTYQFLDLYYERVSARQGGLVHEWTDLSPSYYLLTVQLFTAKGKEGASGDLIASTFEYVDCL